MNNVKLKVLKIHKDAIIPNYAHDGDAGLDLYSVEEKILRKNESILVSTGIKIELPKNTEGQVRPRSGLALKHAITLVNSPGTIDEGYRGEVKIIMINHGKEDFKIEKGMKIAQLLVKPVLRVIVEEVSKISDSERGEGGFGSTGLK